MSVHWLTTGVNPSVRATGFDASTRGWRLHAVESSSDESIAAVRVRPAVCGLVPAHGWGLDLFVDRQCARCARVLSRRASAVDAIVRALEATMRDAPGSATEVMLRRWLDELARSHNVEAMPEGAFDGPVVGADLLSHATAAYWSCKVAQNGGAKITSDERTRLADLDSSTGAVAADTATRPTRTRRAKRRKRCA